MELNKAMVRLLSKHKIVMVSSASKDGKPNASLKGIVEVLPEEGIIYFLDLYSQKTRNNLLENPQVSISIADIDGFEGYQFKGVVELMNDGEMFKKYIKRWERQRTVLLIERMIKNVQKGSSHGRHELFLPEPKYLVKVRVTEIYDLLPHSGSQSNNKKKT